MWKDPIQARDRSRVFMRERGPRVDAEYRIGPLVTCEANAIKSPEGWIIDYLWTSPDWRRKGHAVAVLERIVEVSGMPVRTMAIATSAEGFWEKMKTRGIYQP